MRTPATFERSGDVSKPKYFERYEDLAFTSTSTPTSAVSGRRARHLLGESPRVDSAGLSTRRIPAQASSCAAPPLGWAPSHAGT